MKVPTGGDLFTRRVARYRIGCALDALSFKVALGRIRTVALALSPRKAPSRALNLGHLSRRRVDVVSRFRSLNAFPGIRGSRPATTAHLSNERSVAISRQHRDTLRKELLEDVRALGVVAQRTGDASLAPSLQRRLAEGLRLLEDLAADREDDVGAFALTMPREQLERALMRFHAQAIEELDHLRVELAIVDARQVPHGRQTRESLGRTIARALALRCACLLTLTALAGSAG